MTTKEIKTYRHKYRNYDFKDKKSDEDIILILRRHWLTFIFKFFPIIVGVILLVFMHFVLVDLLRSWFDIDNVDLIYFLESIVAMFLWLIFFILWIDYYFDAWIITDRRIVDIEQQGLFRRNVSELEHSKIQDVTTEIHGVLPTILKYGFVYVQTAGKKGRFVFKEVPHPMFVRKLIVSLQKRIIRERKLEEKRK